ncbi:MAG TPA: hypothetical protein DC049_19340, partial [Spirochaetia bacterium]|nr:hypothetical protein [Spirochaetia bacterium]
MRYTPWPLENGKYRQPDEKEIEEIYGISGEAVRETLLYFEECRGNTAELVEMLNSHIIDNTYTVTREDLLDNKRRYNNEYYFYFQMFCKKIIGRYNWHFGEGSNEQLSEYHKIWEKGIMDNEPWGIDKKNRYINDYASLNLSMYYDFYIRQNEEKSQLFFEFFNKILPDGFITDHDFFQNENFSVSCELIYYGYEFVKIILNINHIAREYAANYSISNKKVIAVMLIAYTGMFSHKIPMIALQKIINKANNVYFIASDISKKTLKYSYQLRNDFDQKKFYIYKKSCIRLSIINALDLLPKVIQTLFKMPRLPVYKSKRFFFETAYPYAECEMEIARISFFNKKDILIALTASIAVSLISFFSLQQLNNLFFYHFVVLFLIFSFILNIAYLKRNNSYLKKNTLEHDFLAESQYQVLIKTSAELLKERNLLEQKVNQRTGELSIANKRLQQLDRLKSDFFANISHELRTPLTLIMTPLETLLKSGGFSVKQKGILSAILLNCSKLGTMINNLLDFSRIEAKKLTINNKPAPICRLLEEYAAQVRPAMESRGIKFIYQNRLPKTFLALVDTGLLEKAVFNLLSNALKFTPAGGKTELILSADRECFFITVKDSGIGIPAEKLEIIFDRFSQADTSSSRKYEGAGIGLYLAREIAILHGGDISVKSRPNEGSEFIIRLPIGDLGAEKSQFFNKTEKNGNDNINKKLWMSINSAQKKETSLIRTEKTDASGHKNNILIVEDNPELRNYLDELLRKKYTIHKAANGREALDIIASAKIDLALAD